MINNQLKENIIQRWLLYVTRSFLQVDFRFQYKLINLSWPDFFSFSWSLTNQVASHSIWPRVLLFDLAHKQCSGIIKGWLHCLTSESRWGFLVNNILMFGSAWCLVMAQIQFSLIKKTIKIGRPENSLTPVPHTSDNISFPQSGRHMCITPNVLIIKYHVCF